MSMLNTLKTTVGVGRPEPVPPVDIDEKKEPSVHSGDAHSSDPERHGSIAFNDTSKGTDVPVEEGAQRGIQKVEAATSAWSTWALAGVLFNIWIIFLTNGMRSSILFSLQPYVTSDFGLHSLLTTIDIVASAMAAASYIPIAKLLDVWGRAEGYALMVGSATLGLILMACAETLQVFCAAQVFYSIGFSGIIYTAAVLAADVTSIKNRGLAFAFTSSPYMITAFAGPKAAEEFLDHVSWQWGFGAFCIIVPAVCAPLFFILKINQKKAEKKDILPKQRSNDPIGKQIWDGILDFDIPGVFLFAAGLTIFLLPFTLATHAPNGWASDYIIAMIVVGFVLLCAFVVYELWFARTPFLNHRFLTDRTVIAACLIDATYQVSYYCWNSYFTSFLQVVCNLSVSTAGYVNSTFQVVSGVTLFIVGYMIRNTGRFKWAFFVCNFFFMLGVGLMIHFRQPNQYIGYIVMCEIFMSLGGSVFILLVQVAVLASVDHQHFAAVLALLYVSGGIGGAVGNAISGTIWTNTFLGALQRELADTPAIANVTTIYASLPAQLAYPIDSPERLGIQRAYGYGQTRMLAAGLGVASLIFVWSAFVRNIDVSKKSAQTKGRVF